MNGSIAHKSATSARASAFNGTTLVSQRRNVARQTSRGLAVRVRAGNTNAQK